MSKRFEKRHQSAKRRAGFKRIFKSILIVCEGEKTEPQYFECFKIPGVNVDVVGEGANTLSLVECAERLVAREKKHGRPYDEVWIVFDRDSFPPANVTNTFKRANSLGYELAFSHEAFELWYLLHFDYRDTGMSRNEYSAALTRKMKRPYKKNDPNMYDLLYPNMAVAIRNARRLAKNYSLADPYHTRNPYTSVFRLVSSLLEELK